MELVELTPIFASTSFKAFSGAGAIKGIRVPGRAGEFGRNKLDQLTDRAKQAGAKGLVWMKVAEDGTPSVAGGEVLHRRQTACVGRGVGGGTRRPPARRRR
ncbi:MAG: GAD domain-containing protein [Ilumatobacteraceae bacterium]